MGIAMQMLFEHANVMYASNPTPLHLFHRALGGFGGLEYPKLDKDNGVFCHCAQGAHQPRQVREHVVLLQGVEEDL